MTRLFTAAVLGLSLAAVGAHAAPRTVQSYHPSTAKLPKNVFWCSTCTYGRPLPPVFTKNPPRTFQRMGKTGYRPFDTGVNRNVDLFYMGRKGNRMEYGYYRYGHSNNVPEEVRR